MWNSSASAAILETPNPITCISGPRGHPLTLEPFRNFITLDLFVYRRIVIVKKLVILTIQFTHETRGKRLKSLFINGRPMTVQIILL